MMTAAVCPRAYLRNYTPDLHQIFLCMLTKAVTWFSSNSVATCYALLVLWMTSRLHAVGRMQGSWCNWNSRGCKRHVTSHGSVAREASVSA